MIDAVEECGLEVVDLRQAYQNRRCGGPQQLAQQKTRQQ
jgi:hypothetical protein